MSIMLPLEGTYTDRHGATHTDPIFYADSYTLTCNSHTNGHRSGDTYEVSGHGNANVEFEVYFYTNEAARIAEKQPIYLKRFRVNLESEPNDQTELLSLFETAIMDFVTGVDEPETEETP